MTRRRCEIHLDFHAEIPVVGKQNIVSERIRRESPGNYIPRGPGRRRPLNYALARDFRALPPPFSSCHSPSPRFDFFA